MLIAISTNEMKVLLKSIDESKVTINERLLLDRLVDNFKMYLDYPTK